MTNQIIIIGSGTRISVAGLISLIHSNALIIIVPDAEMNLGLIESRKIEPLAVPFIEPKKTGKQNRRERRKSQRKSKK